MSAGDTALRALDERLDKLRAASDELKATTREAHEAIKDLKRLGKEVRDLLELEPTKAVAAVMEGAVAKGLEGYATEIREATDAATASVNRRYDELVGILLGYERRDEEDNIGLKIAERAEMVGRCHRCTGKAAVRRYAIEVDALDGDEADPDRRFVVLERYFCGRHPDHYGTVVVDTITAAEVLPELGRVEAKRHGLTRDDRAIAGIPDPTTDTPRSSTP